MNSSMRVAVIPTIRDYPWGAPGHCMGHLVEVLLEAGHDVLWYVAPIDTQHSEVGRLAAKGAIIVRLPDRPPKYVRFAGVRNWVRSLRSEAQSVSAALDAYKPDHIFINQGGTWCALEEEYVDYVNRNAGNYSLICHLNQHSRPFASEQLFKGAANHGRR